MSWLNSPLEVIPQHRAKVRTDWDISKARFCVCVFSATLFLIYLVILMMHQPARAAMMFLIHRSLPQSVKTSMYQSKCSHLLYFTAEMWLWDRCAVFFLFIYFYFPANIMSCIFTYFLSRCLCLCVWTGFFPIPPFLFRVFLSGHTIWIV